MISITLVIPASTALPRGLTWCCAAGQHDLCSATRQVPAAVSKAASVWHISPRMRTRLRGDICQTEAAFETAAGTWRVAEQRSCWPAAQHHVRPRGRAVDAGITSVILII